MPRKAGAPPTERSRKRNRDKCKRYRMRRKLYETQLAAQVATVQNEIALLQLEKTLRNGLSTFAVDQIVHEYHKRFHFGLAMVANGSILSMATTPALANSAASCSPFDSFGSMPLMVTNNAASTMLVNSKSIARDPLGIATELDAKQEQIRATQLGQMVFLKKIMSENLQFGDLVGIHPLVDQWARYGAFHSFLCYELEQLNVFGPIDSPVVVSKATLHVRFSRQTIEQIFPHVLHNERLVQKLIGKLVSYPCHNEFYFETNQLYDQQGGRQQERVVVRKYVVQVGFVEALLKACGNLDDVRLMIEDARIYNESLIGALSQQTLALLAKQPGYQRLVIENSPSSSQPQLKETVDSNSDGEDSSAKEKMNLRFLLS